METKIFLAVSNLSFTGGQPTREYPAAEREFPTVAAAVAWLKELGCGGCVSNYTEIVARVQPGQ